MGTLSLTLAKIVCAFAIGMILVALAQVLIAEDVWQPEFCEGDRVYWSGKPETWVDPSPLLCADA